MRADARRNRALILDAALDLFATRGPAVSMEEIARAAGLGVGTLYRHFPDRQALQEQIAADTLRRLLSAARDLAAGPLPGWEALVLVVRHCAGLPLALAKTLVDDESPPAEVAELTADVNGLIARLAERAQREGSLRSDLPPREVVDLLSVAVCRPGARADDALTIVILDGLKAPTAVGPERGAAVTVD
ncbi:helix-turn-helix domain-containing protein [Actinoallomurus sp. NPDC052274]|uniref:TetR/AcrR family transcriptional regulator n=1 Tax=Actinoallomurus sp. NPDC052274 TaxID=3155420 RepID=UPI003417E1D7